MSSFALMKKVTCLIILFISFRASAQFQPGAELSFNSQKAGYGDTIGHVTTLDLRAWSPLWHQKHSLLSGNIIFINEHFSNFPALYGARARGLSAGLSWTKKISEKHSLIISGDIGLYSDFKNLDSRAIRQRAGLTWITKISYRFSLGYGVEYRNQFYGNQLIPAIVLMYMSKEEDRWKLSGLLPYHPKLTRQFSAHHAISAELKQSFSSYELTAAKDSGTYLRNQKLAFIFNYEYKFQQHWRVLAGIGYSLKQKYEVYSNADSHGWYIINSRIGGDKPTPIASVSQKGVQFVIGIAFNPKF